MRRKVSGFFLLILLIVGLLGAVSSVIQANDEPPAAATPVPVDPRFGAIESFWAAEEAAELGVGWERILFYWNEIQPTNSDYWNTLHVLEEWLVEAEMHDRRVVGLLEKHACLGHRW